MYLNHKFYFTCLLSVLLSACSAGFPGLAPVGDRQAYTRARDCYNEGRYQQAVIELTDYIYKIKNVKRREGRAYRLLGLSYEKLNNPEKALEVYLEALEFHPDNTPLLLAAAQLYQRTGLTDRSMELYEKVLEEEPNNLSALSGQADNYAQQGFYSKARVLYDRFFKEEPQADPLYRARYANTFLKQRNFSQAFQNITLALADEPENPDFWLLSAKARYGLSATEEALADLNTAILLAPARKDLLAQKALWLYREKSFKDSLQIAQQILESDPQNSLALFIKALNEYRLGKTTSAQKQLEEISHQMPHSFTGKVATEFLKNNF